RVIQLTYRFHYFLIIIFFSNSLATTSIYTLSLHDALPIYVFSPLFHSTSHPTCVHVVSTICSVPSSSLYAPFLSPLIVITAPSSLLRSLGSKLLFSNFPLIK